MFDISTTYLKLVMKKLSLSPVKNLDSLAKLFTLLAVLLLTPIAVSGQGTLLGVISDKLAEEPLIAATVVVKGTTTGTVSDYNGEFVLVLKAGT